MIGPVRSAELHLIYRGTDTAKDCIWAEFVDHADGKVDELTCRLQDRDLLWRGAWFPEKGETVVAEIICKDWFVVGDFWKLDCGTFQIDEVTLSGQPDQVEIRCTSNKVQQNARVQKKSKEWEDATLSFIADEVAAQAGLSLDWQGKDRVYDRVDQREESDLSFLRRLSADAGNGVKLSKEELTVYEGALWDGKSATAIILWEPPEKAGDVGGWLRSYTFRTQDHDLYKGCVVTYWHPEKKEYIKGEFFAPDGPQTGEILRVTQPVKDQGEAQTLAQDTLRSKNRREVEAELNLVGDPRRVAAEVLELQGFGRFDKRYFVDEARHVIDGSGGYDTTLKMREVIPY